MFPPQKANKPFSPQSPQSIPNRLRASLWPSALLALTAFPAAIPLAQAHTTQVKGDVAGVWHIEPNHAPQAGKPAKVWIALTRRGGQIVPLSSANCQLKVYNKPRKAGAKPRLQPTLKAITAERYRGIPGADVTFPAVGLYQLELSCAPKAKGTFQPFQMTYDVTVSR